jgi:hypothetical protein
MMLNSAIEKSSKGKQRDKEKGVERGHGRGFAAMGLQHL